jgi:hypothetical protein
MPHCLRRRGWGKGPKGLKGPEGQVPALRPFGPLGPLCPFRPFRPVQSRRGGRLACLPQARLSRAMSRGTETSRLQRRRTVIPCRRGVPAPRDRPTGVSSPVPGEWDEETQEDRSMMTLVSSVSSRVRVGRDMMTRLTRGLARAPTGRTSDSPGPPPAWPELAEGELSEGRRPG